MRTTASMPVPAASGTTMVTDLAGYCARPSVPDAATSNAASPAATRCRRFTTRPPFARVLECARFHPFDVTLEILVDEIEIDKALIGIGQPARDRAPDLPFRSDLD